jgi:hypothetical protein
MTPRRDGDDFSVLLSDLFHELNQPMTGLLCSLELAVQGGGMAKEQALQSLQLAGQLRRCIVSLQKLLADKAPRRSHSTADLGEAFTRVLEELAPIAAAEQVVLRGSIVKRMPVKACAEELGAALFGMWRLYSR